MSAIHFRFLYFMAAVLLFLCLISGCHKDTSPIGNDDRPERPKTGDAILTGHLYYDFFRNKPALNSVVQVYFFDDYSYLLAEGDIDSSGKYYIENLPEDTVDMLIVQPFVDDILLANKIWDIPLEKGVNEVDMEGIGTQNWLNNRQLVRDHFMVRFDTSYAQSQIDAFNSQHNILKVSTYTSLWDLEYSFLEIDPGREILPLIELYHASELTLEAAMVLYEPILEKYYWSGILVDTGMKDWATEKEIENIATDLSLDVVKVGDHIHFTMTKNTPLIFDKLRMYLAFHPTVRIANGYYFETPQYYPAPWE